MTQNIYDNDEFFAGYTRLSRSVEGLDGAAEWPALRALLPELQGLRVLDLGCGFGWFCRWARAEGAARIHGIDVSEKMLARARAETQDPAIAYALEDLERVDLPAGAFDLVFSSLTLHYLENLDRLLSRVYRALVPGGHLVFSAEHPIYTAPTAPGWSTTPAGGKVWPVDSYLEEGPRSTDWLAKGVIKQHRTLANYLNLLLLLGFSLRRIEEWRPTDPQIAARPSLAEERHRPMFFLLSAQRP
jgi:SAM-dependent methyltransferase